MLVIPIQRLVPVEKAELVETPPVEWVESADKEAQEGTILRKTWVAMGVEVVKVGPECLVAGVVRLASVAQMVERGGQGDRVVQVWIRALSLQRW